MDVLTSAMQTSRWTGDAEMEMKSWPQSLDAYAAYVNYVLLMSAGRLSASRTVVELLSADWNIVGGKITQRMRRTIVFIVSPQHLN